MSTSDAHAHRITASAVGRPYLKIACSVWGRRRGLRHSTASSGVRGIAILARAAPPADGIRNIKIPLKHGKAKPAPMILKYQGQVGMLALFHPRRAPVKIVRTAPNGEKGPSK